MERILVVGSPGSGKSTFSRALGELTGLPLIYLDRLFWNADKTTVENKVFDQRLEEAMARTLERFPPDFLLAVETLAGQLYQTFQQQILEKEP